VADVAWSPDGTRLFAAHWNGAVAVWDTATRVRVARLGDSRERMQQIECSPDGRWLAGGDWDSRLYLWDARTLQRVLRSDRIGGQVQALAWSPDSRRVAVGGGAVVHLFEADGWERVGRLVGETGRVNALAFLDDGRTLVSGSTLGAVRFFDLAGGGGRRLLQAEGREPPAGVVFGRDGELAAVAWGHGTVELWDTRARIAVRSLRTGARIRHLDWSRDGARLALADWERDVLVLDPADGALVLRLAVEQPTEVHFAPDGTQLAATTQAGTLSVWNARDGRPAWSASLAPATNGWPGGLFGASWSPDGRELVACNFDGLVQVLDARTGAPLRASRRPGMLFAQYAADGQSILVAAYAENRGLERLDARTLAPLWTSPPTSHLWPVLAPTGERVFSANWSGFLGVWDARTGRLVTEIEGLPPGNPRLGVSPDGTCVVLAAGKYVTVFDARE
jgi:WD40 repeat protein